MTNISDRGLDLYLCNAVNYPFMKQLHVTYGELADNCHGNQCSFGIFGCPMDGKAKYCEDVTPEMWSEFFTFPKED